MYRKVCEQWVKFLLDLHMFAFIRSIWFINKNKIMHTIITLKNKKYFTYPRH